MVNASITLIEKECPECHLLYWLTEAHNKRLSTSKESFSCPNGHLAHYEGKTEAQKYEEEKIKTAELKEDIEQKKEAINTLKKENKAYKGHITRLKGKKKQ